ncbi:CreA family protein [Granulosicoccus sp. 3-233]|uniref:CreA family protein n=1 Tax=Granulosicoccus sp. 3-233 TaxID=3417969 RepID=UPI003D34E4D8
MRLINTIAASFTRPIVAATLLSTAVLTSATQADEVGDVNVDWMGGDIKIEAVEDPKVKGVTCHISYFDRGLIDRVRNGEIFSDPSNSSIACRQTGPIVIGDIDRDEGGENVFSKRTSLVWKSLQVTRIYDEERQTLIYLSHASQVKDGSAKMALSTVPLFGQDVTWED